MMITTEQEYTITQDCVRQFSAQLERLQQASADAPWRATRIAAARSQLTTLQRELALWDAGIREPVPGRPDLPPVAEDIDSRRAAALVKRAEIAQIDRAIGEALDRIADWRRHRAWLEREIAELEAQVAVAS